LPKDNSKWASTERCNVTQKRAIRKIGRSIRTAGEYLDIMSVVVAGAILGADIRDGVELFPRRTCELD